MARSCGQNTCTKVRVHAYREILPTRHQTETYHDIVPPYHRSAKHNLSGTCSAMLRGEKVRILKMQIVDSDIGHTSFLLQMQEMIVLVCEIRKGVQWIS